MNPRVSAVKPNRDYTLAITFTDGEMKIFDVKLYLDKGIFKELKDLSLFFTVKPVLGTARKIKACNCGRYHDLLNTNRKTGSAG